tara:strand:+ start:699 stop:1100 length:402 start_codon:yes stop_codon:yes gene_type:complete
MEFKMQDNMEIFSGKTFQDLTKDIYENSKNKKLQLDLLIQEIHGFINSIDDAILIGPIVKEIYEAAIKNDEHLVKLASVLQRLLSRSTSGADEDSFLLSESEKEELINTLQDTAAEIQQKSDKINEIKLPARN